MAEALRRLLVLLPTLPLGTVGLFFVLSLHPGIERTLELPLFYRSEPESAKSAALAALAETARGDPNGPGRLLELGGAALPHVLPELAVLGVAERRQVADALEPLAERMGERTARSRSSRTSPSLPAEVSDERVLFWQRYYEEHDLDFRELSVERLVRRLAIRRAGLRQADLLAVDTFALPYLVAHLGRVRNRGDVERIERLLPHIDRLLGQTSELPTGASIEQARRVATEIRRDFDRRGARFVELDRLETWTARLTQTEFGIWAARMVRELSGLDSPLVLAAVSASLAHSWLSYVLYLVGALLLGPLLSGAVQFSRTGRRASAEGTPGAPRAGLLAALLELRPRLLLSASYALALLPASAVPASTVPASGSGPTGSLALPLLALLAGAIASWFLLELELSERLDWRTGPLLARRPPAARLLTTARWLLPTLPALLPLLGVELLAWVATLELSSGRPGLYRGVIDAVSTGDLPFLMTVALGAVVLVAVLQILADAALSPLRSWGGPP